MRSKVIDMGGEIVVLREGAPAIFVDYAGEEERRWLRNELSEYSEAERKVLLELLQEVPSDE